jgi:3-phytase
MKLVKHATLVLFVVISGFLVSCASKPVTQQLAPRVIKPTKKAVVLEYTETRTENLINPVLETGRTGLLSGDADDPAIWIHPTDSSKSLIFGIDKVDGLWVWDMTGKELTHVDGWGKPGNVDVRYGLELGGKRVDIVVMNLRKVKYVDSSKLAVYAINPDYTSGEDVLVTLADGQTENNDIQNGTYGFGLYSNPETGLIYAFENASTGPISQYLIEDDGTGAGIKLTLVRELVYDGKTCEGMVADDELGFFYVGEEDTAVHKYYAEPDKSPESIHSFAFAEDGYSRDREGISLFNFDDGTGYFLVVDQGDASNQIASILRIYERQGDNKLVKTVAHLDINGKPMWDDDGVDSNSTPILPLFPNGIVVGHDGANSVYTIYDWRDVAGSDLNLGGN